MPCSSTVQPRDFGHLPSQKRRSLYSEAIQTSSIEALNNKDSFIFLNLYKQRASVGAVCIKTNQKKKPQPQSMDTTVGQDTNIAMLFLVFFSKEKKISLFIGK